MGTMGSHRHDVMGVPSTTHHGRRKRTRTRPVFSNLQRKGLEKRFQLQKYITESDSRQLGATLGLTDTQVKVWFKNRRTKWRHAELKKREQQQLQQKQQQDQSTAGKEEQQQQKQQEVSSSPERGEISEDIHYIIENYDDDDDDEEIDPVEGCLQEDCPPRDISVI
ncbi:hypothetical protein SK128_013932 [Halocaridina rubra]|uniref:Homeobox domain-containing protein n=1 Tax=Halocaridina rubra TaxID=373956 RepID=A0AAN8WZR7_HALRR